MCKYTHFKNMYVMSNIVFHSNDNQNKLKKLKVPLPVMLTKEIYVTFFYISLKVRFQLPSINMLYTELYKNMWFVCQTENGCYSQYGSSTER